MYNVDHNFIDHNIIVLSYRPRLSNNTKASWDIYLNCLSAHRLVSKYGHKHTLATHFRQAHYFLYREHRETTRATTAAVMLMAWEMA